ncbi:mechanosensitive ion channel family protein [Gangjinia marincola]|uniref:Mechanosensitive ion channel family protein n=1 Tax=Gangjinia marincola TaxID=578463 RepID=A0ABN1MCU9_9FLAO
MIELIQAYQSELIYTLVLILVLLFVRFLFVKGVRKVTVLERFNVVRKRLMIRYINIGITIFGFLGFELIWQFQFEDISLVFSSVFAVLGVGLFAAWSILSNVTSGVIMFFSFPFRIGDRIKVHDKDVELEGVIEDIRAFHLHMRKDNGELITYPNNLMLQKAISVLNHSYQEDDGDSV